jgi:hypothetical protein
MEETVNDPKSIMAMARSSLLCMRAGKTKAVPVIAQRVLAVLAAILLIASVSIATLGPPGLPLGQTVILIDRSILDTIQAAIDTHLAHWVWTYLFVPWLVRPAWLLPASAGLVCAGASMTLASRHAARNQHRRRS